MSDAGSITITFLACLDRCKAETYPYRHWLIDSILPDDACAAIDPLPVQHPAIGDTLDRRETNNSTRLFFGVPQRAAYPVCEALTTVLQSDTVVRRLEALCGAVLAGSSLRIEYCLDIDGFWLESYTDIGAKLYTMLIHLPDEPGSDAWGTDILDGPDRFVASAPFVRNGGLIFIPGTDTCTGSAAARSPGCGGR